MSCYFCMAPVRDDGSTFHHPNCAGLEPSDLNNLQVHNIEAQRDRLAEALQKIVRDGDYTAPEEMKRIAREALTICGCTIGSDNG